MKKSVNINFNLSNKVAYTLIAIMMLLIMGVGVYAVSHPNPGHSASEIEEADPSVLEFAKTGTTACSGSNQSIKSISSTGVVTCETDDVGSGGLASCRTYLEHGIGKPHSPSWSAYSSGNTAQCSGWSATGASCPASGCVRLRVCIQCQ